MLVPDAPEFAGTGGPVRSYQFIQMLAEHSDVTIFVFNQEQTNDDIDRLRQAGVKIIFAEPQTQSNALPSRHFRSIRNLIFGFRDHGRQWCIWATSLCVWRQKSTATPSWTKRLQAKILLRFIAIFQRPLRFYPTDVLLRQQHWDSLKKNITGVSADVIWCEHSYLYPLAVEAKAECQATKIVVNCHNVEWILKQSIAQNAQNPLTQQHGLLEAQRLKSWESQMLDGSDVILCCSDADKVEFQHLAPAAASRIHVAPNGVDTSHYTDHINHHSEHTVLFTGTAGYPPNDEAVNWLVHEIFPAVRKAISNAKLIIAGRNAAKHWARHAQTPGLKIVSDVPDMRELFCEATICVAPLKSGSGTRLKILEAISSHRAVVSTTIGAEGLHLKTESEILIRDTAEEFAKGIIQLLTDPETQQQIAANGRAAAVHRFDWSFITMQAAKTLCSTGILSK